MEANQCIRLVRELIEHWDHQILYGSPVSLHEHFFWVFGYTKWTNLWLLRFKRTHYAELT